MMKTMMGLMAGGLSCEQVDEGLDDYLEGEMSWAKRMRFRMHLLVCKACSAYLAAYRKTVELVKSSFDRPGTDNDAAAPVDEDLIQSILDAQSRGDVPH